MSHRILAILDRPRSAHLVLATAALAARRMGDAQIEALHLRHDALEGFMPTEEIMSQRREQAIENAASMKSIDMRKVFDDWHRQAGIGDWREVIGETAKVVAAEAGGADLVVGHGAELNRNEAKQAIHVALFEAKLATLLVPDTVPRSLGRSIAVAWKPSKAIDRSVDAAMPLLLRAEKVTVLKETADDDREVELVSYLRRLQQADVPVTIRQFQAKGRKIGAALIEEAHSVDADLLVMGAYSRGHLAEFFFGGATQEALAIADLPVLMRH